MKSSTYTVPFFIVQFIKDCKTIKDLIFPNDSFCIKRFPKYFVFFQNSIFRKKWALYEEMRALFRKKQHMCFNFVKLGDESRSI